MCGYAFVGYLDFEIESKFTCLWRDLSEQNITHYGIETKGKRPHITIADYNNLDKSRFIELLDEYYEDKSKVDMSLSILGTFLNTGTLFFAPILSSELNDFHKNHHNHFIMFNENENSLYLPGKWNPHCTIASRLSDENMLRAFRFCKENIDKLSCKLNEVALIEIKFNREGIAVEDSIIFRKELK